MKKLSISVLFLVLTSLFISFSANCQSYHSGSDNVTLELKKPGTGEVVHTLTMGVEKLLITPSGNFLRTVSFTIDADHPIMNFSGPRKILEVTMRYDIDGDGTAEIITDTMAVLTRSGNLKFVFHSNGAGTSLPRGWDF